MIADSATTVVSHGSSQVSSLDFSSDGGTMAIGMSYTHDQGEKVRSASVHGAGGRPCHGSVGVGHFRLSQ